MTNWFEAKKRGDEHLSEFAGKWDENDCDLYEAELEKLLNNDDTIVTYAIHPNTLLNINNGKVSEEKAMFHISKVIADLLAYFTDCFKSKDIDVVKKRQLKVSQATYTLTLYKDIFKRYRGISEYIDNTVIMFTVMTVSVEMYVQQLAKEKVVQDRESEFYSMVKECASLYKSRKAKHTEEITYLLKNSLTGLVKIGRTANLKQRKKSLECASGCKLDVLATINGDIEQSLHKQFKHLRVHGEWFSPGKDLLEYINSLP